MLEFPVFNATENMQVGITMCKTDRRQATQFVHWAVIQ